jgi:DNA processing protein
LIQQDITVVSGMAFGVDQVAHSAALHGSGKTIGVLGGGMDFFHIEDSLLHTQMWEKALLVSEFPMGTPPTRHTFPTRNRTISGLSQGTLVVEAGNGSGALITAREAKKQNRPVFVTPGSLLHSNNAGGHRLLQSHGTLVLSPKDIIHAIRGDSISLAPNALCEELPMVSSQKRCLSKLSILQSKVVEALDAFHNPFDVAQSCKEPLANIYSTLIELEQMNLVSRQPGDRYVRR